MQESLTFRPNKQILVYGNKCPPKKIAKVLSIYYKRKSNKEKARGQWIEGCCGFRESFGSYRIEREVFAESINNCSVSPGDGSFSCRAVESHRSLSL